MSNAVADYWTTCRAPKMLKTLATRLAFRKHMQQQFWHTTSRPCHQPPTSSGLAITGIKDLSSLKNARIRPSKFEASVPLLPLVWRPCYHNPGGNQRYERVDLALTGNSEGDNQRLTIICLPQRIVCTVVRPKMILNLSQ